jgi:hypothetical protein
MTEAQVYFRTAIVGAQQQKVAKVVSILNNELSPLQVQLQVQDLTNEPNPRQIHIEYIPCVATFDSYENEKGLLVRYLAKLEYHGKDGLAKGASLAPFFDEQQEQEQEDDRHKHTSNDIRISGIRAIAIGCGLELEEDVGMITSFINVLSGNTNNSNSNSNSDGKDDTSISIKCIAPNDEYSSMKEETIAYKNLTAEEKERVTESQLIGPGKMAKFTMDLSKECIPRSKQAIAEEEAVAQALLLKEKEEGTNTETVTVAETSTSTSTSTALPLPLPMPKEYDPNTTRYACKMCRTIICNTDDLENPSHTQSQHSFSMRKSKKGSNTCSGRGANMCQSLFLANGLDWMGDISLSAEGKLSCPNVKCGSKLGLFKWHGTQCSCGTWVVPAIMIQKSRVDIINPVNSMSSDLELLMGQNPLARLHVGGGGGGLQ